MADTYTVYVIRNGELVPTDGSSAGGGSSADLTDVLAKIAALQEQVSTVVAAATAAATAAADAQLVTSPWLLGTTGGIYPPRPATTRPVWFVDPNVQPGNDGQVTGGGGMVPEGTLPGGLTDFWIS